MIILSSIEFSPNLESSSFKGAKVDSLKDGVYIGWAKVGQGTVYKALISVGFNPFFKNVKKSVETHILHDYKRDFYGECLSVSICGFIREMSDFGSLEELIYFIKKDIELGEKLLDEKPFLDFKYSNFFCEERV